MSSKNIICCVLLLLVGWCWSQEKSRYSRNQDSFRRHYTSSEDKNILMPTYNDLASDNNKGVTLEDWEKHLLSRERFLQLDADKDGFISREELAKDPLQGEAELRTQTKALIGKYCGKEIPDYKEKLSIIEREKGYGSIGDEEYVLDKDSKLDVGQLCQYPGCNEAWTKKYIQFQAGEPVKLKVCVGHYARLLIEDQEREEDIMPYLFGAVLLGLITLITFLSPIFTK